MEKNNLLNIEVVYAKPEETCVVAVHMPLGATVQEAITRSNILTRFPEIDLQKNTVGIFGRIVLLTTTLQSGDRIEIYRGLLMDPKLARRQRVKRERKRR